MISPNGPADRLAWNMTSTVRLYRCVLPRPRGGRWFLRILAGQLPRAVKRARRNAYRVKKPGDHGTRHDGPPTIQLANPVLNKTMTSIAA
jgi:hypothetical protein